jgi:hypothetical protein
MNTKNPNNKLFVSKGKGKSYMYFTILKSELSLIKFNTELKIEQYEPNKATVDQLVCSGWV